MGIGVCFVGKVLPWILGLSSTLTTFIHIQRGVNPKKGTYEHFARIAIGERALTDFVAPKRYEITMVVKIVERKKANSYNICRGGGIMSLILRNKRTCPPFDLFEGRKDWKTSNGVIFLRRYDN